MFLINMKPVRVFVFVFFVKEHVEKDPQLHDFPSFLFEKCSSLLFSWMQATPGAQVLPTEEHQTMQKHKAKKQHFALGQHLSF